MPQQNKIGPLDRPLPLGLISAATLVVRMRYEEETLFQTMARDVDYRERVRY